MSTPDAGSARGAGARAAARPRRIGARGGSGSSLFGWGGGARLPSESAISRCLVQAGVTDPVMLGARRRRSSVGSGPPSSHLGWSIVHIGCARRGFGYGSGTAPAPSSWGSTRAQVLRFGGLAQQPSEPRGDGVGRAPETRVFMTRSALQRGTWERDGRGRASATLSLSSGLAGDRSTRSGVSQECGSCCPGRHSEFRVGLAGVELIDVACPVWPAKADNRAGDGKRHRPRGVPRPLGVDHCCRMGRLGVHGCCMRSSADRSSATPRTESR